MKTRATFSRRWLVVAVAIAALVGVSAATYAAILQAVPPIESPGAKAGAPAVRVQTPTPPPVNSVNPTGWPDASNTGVPAGVALAAYTGPCTLTSPVTITGQDVKAKCDGLLVQTMGVVISNSRLPRVDSTFGDGRSSVTITDSDVIGGNWSDGAVWGYNISATRVEITGGQHSFHCNENCTLIDSWLHAQYNPAGQSYHNNAFISNGGSNMTVTGNRLHCDAQVNATDGGCTADLSLFGDFDSIANVTVNHNLFVSNSTGISYCLYAGYNPGKPYGSSPSKITVTNNVFQRGSNSKCGVWGPVTSYLNANGNVWSGNTWEDGATVPPAA